MSDKCGRTFRTQTGLNMSGEERRGQSCLSTALFVGLHSAQRWFVSSVSLLTAFE